MSCGNNLRTAINIVSQQSGISWNTRIFTLLYHSFNVKYFASFQLRRMSTTTTPKISLLVPPVLVKGMKELDRKMFKKKVKLPSLRIKAAVIEQVIKHLKPFMLKMYKLQPLRDVADACPSTKVMLLHPDIISSYDDFQPNMKDLLSAKGIENSSFGWEEVELGYENWKCDEILQAVLPEEGARAYSRIGHIVHLNLREYLFSYRFLIGQVILDKLQPGVTCVVNKTETIDNTYRNFTMEVIAGKNDMLANVKESGCQFEFNFADVFWNPRLNAEHERLVAKLDFESVLYDVFAGVGPFAIPAARFKKCQVLANDLNEDSYKWLEHNIKLNKVGARVKAFNLDGRQFICEVVKQDIVSRWDHFKSNADDQSCVWEALNITMNLPALAVEFLDAFRGLLSDHKHLADEANFVAPTVHCYMFCKEKNFSDACIQRVESVLCKNLDRATTEVYNVRNVAPNKEMIRVSFKLTNSVIFDETPSNETVTFLDRETTDLDEPLAKRLCSSKNEVN